MRSAPYVVAACLFAAAAGFGLYRNGGFGLSEASQPLPPGLQLQGLDGKPHRLDEWRGKLLLVNFWATWCTPCLHEIPDLVKLEQHYGPRGFQIIGPAVDDPESVRSMIGQLGIDYPVMVGMPDDLISLMETLGNKPGGLPFSILVNPEGMVFRRQLGEFGQGELAALIEQHLPASLTSTSP